MQEQDDRSLPESPQTELTDDSCNSSADSGTEELAESKASSSEEDEGLTEGKVAEEGHGTADTRYLVPRYCVARSRQQTSMYVESYTAALNAALAASPWPGIPRCYSEELCSGDRDGGTDHRRQAVLHSAFDDEDPHNDASVDSPLDSAEAEEDAATSSRTVYSSDEEAGSDQGSTSEEHVRCADNRDLVGWTAAPVSSSTLTAAAETPYWDLRGTTPELQGALEALPPFVRRWSIQNPLHPAFLDYLITLPPPSVN